MRVTSPQAKVLRESSGAGAALQALHWLINIMQIKAIDTQKVVLSEDSLIKYKLMQNCEVLAAFFLLYDNAVFVLFCFVLTQSPKQIFSGERMLWHGETTVQPQQGKTEKHLAQ